jgi:hypothetical protein
MLIFVTPQFPSDKCDVTATQIADDWLVQFGAEFLNPRREHCQTHRRLLNFLKFPHAGQGGTGYTERLSSLGGCPPVSDRGGAPLELRHTVQIWLSRCFYRVEGIFDGTQVQRQRTLSFTDSAISCQLSGYLLGLGIAVKAHLSKIWRSLCYRSKFHPQLLAVKVNFNVALILPQ